MNVVMVLSLSQALLIKIFKLGTKRQIIFLFEPAGSEPDFKLGLKMQKEEKGKKKQQSRWFIEMYTCKQALKHMVKSFNN